MTLVDITVGDHALIARLEEALAPRTCAAFRAMMPYQDQLIHVRWSGEGCWIPMGPKAFDLPWESHTCYPRPGQFIFYPGGLSETEILLAYGEVRFSSRFGQLPGNHFLTVVEGMEHLTDLGHATLWRGAQPIRFALRHVQAESAAAVAGA
ncbi:DUF3830 family protein [Caulobacter sp. KR2-114]|uniref:DUF3830 family protein n=1 Tax=Caulobacter sp. KR2-114 TaxID=3400912 RepID=UPI003BFCCDF9